MSHIGQIGRMLLVAICAAACQTTSSHQFTAPAPDWRTKTGQLSYSDSRLTLIGEVIVRYSKRGDFEMSFTKAGGLTLVHLRRDSSFGEISGPLARGRWSGEVSKAPARLRGWFALRDQIVTARKAGTVRHDSAEQSFTLRF